jgi:carboxymethylenebutenolidase
MGQTVEFNRPDGGTTQGHLAEAGDGKPGIVVIQEWWGLNDQIRGVADRFAAAGYNALAPDLYQGRVTQDPDEAGHMMEGLDFPGATHQDLRGAVQLLKESSPKVAVMGFCMGGALTVAGAVHIAEADAGVCYYGIPPKDFADPGKIGIPFQGHFANQDDWCTPAAVNELEDAMRAAGVAYDVYRYDAKHGFFNETSPAHDAACAAQSWERMIPFLEAHL